jgi:hypothetical protein
MTHAMKNILPSLIMVTMVFAGTARAQKCPSIRVSSADLIKAGETTSFTAVLSGGDPAVTPTYNWSISAGTIESGQGTSNIVVNSTGLGGQSITATVDVGGYARECVTSNSSTISVEESVKDAEMVMNGTYLNSRSFAEEASKFANDIQTAYSVVQAPHAVVILYPGKTAAAAAIKDMTRSLKAVFAKKGMNSSTYKIITGGKRPKTSYEMWSVPDGGKDPVPDPVK